MATPVDDGGDRPRADPDAHAHAVPDAGPARRVDQGHVDRAGGLAARRRPHVDALQRQDRDVGRLRRRARLRAHLGPGDRALPVRRRRASTSSAPATCCSPTGGCSPPAGTCWPTPGSQRHGAPEPAHRVLDARARDMARGRWYPTTTTLPDGKVLIVSGDGIPATAARTRRSTSRRTRSPRSMTRRRTRSRRCLARRARCRCTRSSSCCPTAASSTPDPDKTTRILNLQTGTWSTLASQSPIDGHSAVMYRPGKILKTGTWTDPDFPASVPITNRAAAIDMTETVPTWREVAPMHFKRTFQTLTVLPDRRRARARRASRRPTATRSPTRRSSTPEIWHPETDTWTDMAPSVRPRGYHSTSLLLPDGRILLAGSGRLDGSLMPNETTAEIYSPPYLHKGPRPTITLAPDRLRLRRVVHGRHAGRRQHREGRADPHRLGHARPEHGPALPGADVSPQRRPADDRRARRTRTSRRPASTTSS